MTLVLFADRNLGREFSRIVREAHPQIEELDAHFRQDCPDDEWLCEVGKRGWVVVTHDQRIRYQPNELEAVMENQVALLVLVGKEKYPEMARHFVHTLPRVMDFVQSHQPPYIAKVYMPSPRVLGQPGRVELWYPKPEA